MLTKHLSSLVSRITSKVSLRTVLIVPFVLQTFTAVGVVGWLSFRNGQKAVNDVASQLRTEVTSRIDQHISTYLAAPHIVNENNANAIRRRLLNPEDFSQMGGYFWDQLHAFKTVSFIQFGSEAGTYIGAERTNNGKFNLEIKDATTGSDKKVYVADDQGNRTPQQVGLKKNYDPRVRGWYKAAKAAGKPAWSKVYQFSTNTAVRLGVMAVLPFYDTNGTFQGVLGTDIVLSQLGDFLSHLKIGSKGQTFIIERDGLLVASSTVHQPFTVDAKGEAQRLKAIDSQEFLVRFTSQNLLKHFGSLEAITSNQQFDFMLDRQRQFVQVSPLKDGRGIDWLIVVVVPESDFMGQINANTRTTILLCLAALALAILLGIITSRWITQPIVTLGKASKAIAAGELDQKVAVESVHELGDLAASFNRMALQLQESFTVLEAKNAELRRLDQLKDEFLANTSHELRTPLNGIIGIADSLIDGVTGQLSSPTISNLQMIVASGRRLSNLVNDILDFATLKNKTIELQLKPVGMWAIAETVLTLSRPLVGRKNLQLINLISLDSPPVNADENRLQQILHNLVGNAIKFTESGTITIAATTLEASVSEAASPLATSANEHQPPQFLKITVSDTGIGIPEDKFDRIFTSFEQAEGSTARQYGGTGLGLAITQQLVALHGGHIWVESILGEGSQFSFTLPIFVGEIEHLQPITPLQESVHPSTGEISSSMALAAAPRASTTDQFQILIVDDEPINRQVLVNHLSLANYAITQATNGQEAVEIIENGFKPDLILLDVMMPRMTGYEVTEKIRENFPATDLPILLLTAKTQVQDLVTGLSVGANDYLNKPIYKDELLARIKTHINLRHLRDENTRLSAELEITRRLQQMLLPKEEELRQIPGLDIAGFMEPAEEVGGDYYDVLTHEGRVKIGIGDVTGHGLESGVVMLMAQMAVRTLLESNETDPQQFAAILNRAIYHNVQRMDSDKMMTLALIDYTDQGIHLTGQHESILIARSDGKIERINTGDLGIPLGLEEDISDFIQSLEINLQPGDGIILYTDGITEADNSEGVQYGLPRLMEVVSRHWQKSASEIQQAVMDDLRHHIGQQTVYDDITLLVLKKIALES